MASMKDRPIEPIPLHRVLREVYRNYSMFQDYVAATGNHVIDHGYWTYEADEDEDGNLVPTDKKKDKVAVSISFWDLQDGVQRTPERGGLSKRKNQAVMLNVIQDKKQKEVAEIMGITTVSVGQYVEQAMIQLAETYFADELSKSSKEQSSVKTGVSRKG